MELETGAAEELAGAGESREVEAEVAVFDKEVEFGVAVEVAGEDEFGGLVADFPALEDLFGGAGGEFEAGERGVEAENFDAVGAGVAGEEDGVLFEEGAGFGAVEAGGDGGGFEATGVDEGLEAGAVGLPGKAIAGGSEGKPTGGAGAAGGDGRRLGGKKGRGEQQGYGKSHGRPYDRAYANNSFAAGDVRTGAGV